MPQREESRWEAFQSRPYDEDAQEQIRRAIREGIIRVVPESGGGVRIVVQRASEADAASSWKAAAKMARSSTVPG